MFARDLADGYVPSVAGSEFAWNTAGEHGGGLFLFDAEWSVDSAAFKWNRAAKGTPRLPKAVPPKRCAPLVLCRRRRDLLRAVDAEPEQQRR